MHASPTSKDIVQIAQHSIAYDVIFDSRSGYLNSIMTSVLSE